MVKAAINTAGKFNSLPWSSSDYFRPEQNLLHPGLKFGKVFDMIQCSTVVLVHASICSVFQALALEVIDEMNDFIWRHLYSIQCLGYVNLCLAHTHFINFNLPLSFFLTSIVNLHIVRKVCKVTAQMQVTPVFCLYVYLQILFAVWGRGGKKIVGLRNFRWKKFSKYFYVNYKTIIPFYKIHFFFL